jgi:acyl-homoserine-lactone acylase
MNGMYGFPFPKLNGPIRLFHFFILCFFFLPVASFAQAFSSKEIARWEKQAAQVSILRDNWGIPHIYGKTDADAVFGLLYAQCEDDFKRIEMNYIEKLGRMAEVKGESSLYDDLLIRLIIDAQEAKSDFSKSPRWLKKLLNAQADALNYYLYKHPEVKPALLTRFEPWFNLLWTDGSIGAINTDILTPDDLKELYGGEAIGSNDSHRVFEKTPLRKASGEPDPTGSNGFAFGPSITASGNAILYINPHVTFYFRPEVHLVSEQGLNTYGAVTWGQFFVYQGFNEHCGWMHTSSYADISDTYIEKLSKVEDRWFYEYDGQLKPVRTKTISLCYLKGGRLEEKFIEAMYTHHGPIMAKRDGQWMSMKAMNRSLTSLKQSWLRTKASSFAEFQKIMELRGNTSNNTVYADAAGNIAYWHGNFMPIRDTKFDWSKPVDGSTSATEWKGLHPVAETVHLINPPNGWIQNCNSTPFTAAGVNSPKRADYPPYMAPDGENYRGLNAVRVLASEKKYTIDKAISAGYDTRLTAFETLVPALVKAFELNVHPGDSLFDAFKNPIQVLKKWDFHAGESSVPTTLAVEWGERLLPSIQQVHNILLDEEADQVQKTKQFIATAEPDVLLLPFLETLRDLEKRFGTWQVAWGEINRYQRISEEIEQPFDDSKTSYPVGFASSTWGMLPSYNARYFPGTLKRYGVNGNSFVCVVAFGKHLSAKSLLAGGQSGHQLSPHFTDQLESYTKGRFKEVLFYEADVLKHVARRYHPGE